ncbi:MAG: protein kinase [Holophagales bacterium]|nr:protein kinase [Holophagales bacterium]
MDPEREQRLADLLLEAFDRPTAEQQAFLEEACGTDREMLAEALGCLAREERLEDFLMAPAAGTGWSTTDETTLASPWRPNPHENGPAQAEADTADASRTSHLGRSRLGAYRLEGLLGEGGMGQVYLGEDERLGRQVAVKILPPEMAGSARLERFEREARALAALNHPNIVTIHSIEEDDGIRFLTMERVDGTTLKEKIKEGPLSEEEILQIGLELSEALAAAHRRGVVHRDLKPANVMLAEDGRVKVVDFGIAANVEESRDLTQGRMVGTISYMAPEQLEGERADERSDLFALGVILYQMATGDHPFAADTTVRQIRLILDNDPPPARTRRAELSPELDNVIRRCLEKAPARRYGDAATVAGDLTALLEARVAEKVLGTRSASRISALPPDPHRRRLAGVAALTAVVLLAAFAALWFLRESSVEPPAPAPTEAAASKVTLAVLPFRNLAGAAELGWLADGIAELLITDLAQSPELVVFGRAEVRRILADLGAEAKSDLDPGELHELARKGDLGAVVRGSFIRAGELFRLSYSLESPQEGQVLASASFEGQGEESLFRLVDELSAHLVDTLGASLPELTPPVVESTTASLLAWQAYTEGLDLYQEDSQAEEAIARLQQALTLDPDFALAAIAASKMFQSLGRNDEAELYSKRAFEGVDRLPLRTRFNVEAGYYGTRWANLGRAIETYALALKIYPDSPWRRNNLARRYAFFERYREAEEQFDRAIRSGENFWGDVAGAATVQAALDDFAAGDRLLAEALARQPEHWMLGYSRAWHLSEWGRFEAAEEAFADLARRRSEGARLPYGRWRLATLRGDLPGADRHARRLLEIDDAFARWRGNISLAKNALFQGRAQEALIRFADAVAASRGADRALARCFKAELQLFLGEADGALAEAEQAILEGDGHWPELRGLFLAARAEEALGRSSEADERLEILRDRWRQQPNAVEERQILRLTGLLSLARGNAEAGVDTLERAAALLPPRGVEFSWHVFPDHVPLWVELGEAELARGRPEAALAWLARARSAGSERLERPVPYVRGLYLEALAREGTGSPSAARQGFERFLTHWEGSELATGWQAEARSRLASPTRISHHDSREKSGLG